jgi:hypothetical protein
MERAQENNVETTHYEEVLRHVQSLTRADQERLLTELAEQLQSKPDETKSILELQGLGKEIWAGVDIEKYLEQERSSWNG